jgi:hypothetical protein
MSFGLRYLGKFRLVPDSIAVFALDSHCLVQTKSILSIYSKEYFNSLSIIKHLLSKGIFLFSRSFLKTGFAKDVLNKITLFRIGLNNILFSFVVKAN